MWTDGRAGLNNWRIRCGSRTEYLGDEDAQAELLALLDEYDLRISALATHNNPLHPDDETAEQADTELREAVELADQSDVNTLTCFSGLPAGSPNDETPNWITVPWPTEHADAHEYQWEEVAIPYWRDLADYAAQFGVDLAIEMHPNRLVYEPSRMARLRDATNERVGANFDRSWLFRSVGDGHGEDHWKDVVSTLRMVGYDGALGDLGAHTIDLARFLVGVRGAIRDLRGRSRSPESSVGDSGERRARRVADRRVRPHAGTD